MGRITAAIGQRVTTRHVLPIPRQHVGGRSVFSGVLFMYDVSRSRVSAGARA